MRFNKRCEELGVPQLQDWPKPLSPTLREIVNSLRSRSKAIKNKVGDFEVSLVEEYSDGERFERLKLEMVKFTGAEQKTEIGISFWHDFVLRLDFRRRGVGRRGWDYKFGRFGDFTNVQAKEVAELVESTVSTFTYSLDTIDELWSDCRLTPIDA